MWTDLFPDPPVVPSIGYHRVSETPPVGGGGPIRHAKGSLRMAVGRYRIQAMMKMLLRQWRNADRNREVLRWQ